MLSGIIQPLFETLQLLLFGDVQVKLEDSGVMLDETLLKGVDAVISFGPDTFGDKIVDTNDQHIFVMRAVENHNFSPSRDSPVCPPKEVVGQFFPGGLTERRHPATLGVHGTQNVLDCAIFSASVHGLEADQKRKTPLGVK